MTYYLPGHLFVISPQAVLVACYKHDNGDTEYIWFQIFNNTQIVIRSSHYG